MRAFRMRIFRERRSYPVCNFEVLEGIDELAGKRGRSKFIREALESEVIRRKFLKALKICSGAWDKVKHPELKMGVGKYVKKLRREWERSREEVELKEEMKGKEKEKSKEKKKAKGSSGSGRRKTDLPS